MGRMVDRGAGCMTFFLKCCKPELHWNSFYISFLLPQFASSQKEQFLGNESIVHFPKKPDYSFLSSSAFTQ